jgi:hypothetical protein
VAPISPVVRFRAPSDVVSEPAVVVELREQLLVWERGLDEWEDALLVREHGMWSLNVLIAGHVWSATLFMTRPRPSGRTIGLGCALLPPIDSVL